MASLRPGWRAWEMDRDQEAHRNYSIQFLVECGPTEGPARALLTPGLPQPGDVWVFGNDIDMWAFCQWEAKIRPEVDKEKNTFFVVTQKFSTRPPDLKACKEFQFEDPLLEPQKVSGTFSKFTTEATTDRFGKAIMNSAFELMRGPSLEFDDSRGQIRVEQNVPLLEQTLIYSIKDCVNDATLWGFPRRCVKLSNISWERKFYGACYVYYTRTFEFDVDLQTFDRDLLDEGTKALNGHWADVGTSGQRIWVLDNIGGQPPNPFNPSHYTRFKDPRGENAKVILDGAGQPIQDPVQGQVTGAAGTPITITTATPHGLSSGAIVAISNVGGNQAANGGPWIITVTGTTTFQLVSSASSGTYTSGGYWTTLGAGGPGSIHVERYREANMFLLAIPTTL